ncbi:MAG TPA: alkaline phosphatase family protein [Acidobacteriaceae bacterium]|nr:alkaline phosphatase family protein [Acidobacteriaceae bacterium]
MRAFQCCTFLAFLSSATAAFATVTVTSPSNGATVTSPVHYVATATASTCSKGVASMGIYVDNTLVYSVSGASLNTSVTMSAGSHQTAVQEWDNCGGASNTPIDVTVVVPAPPALTIFANSPTILDGRSTVLDVAASGATSVTVSGPTGTYTLSSSGGQVTVSPTATGTYTAEATNANGTTSADATVTVLPANALQPLLHVIFMLQENHTFDNYFGMLNPYRKTNGWNIGADGKEYDVDGIDDKLDTISNSDDEGTSYPLFKFTSTCIDDETSSWLESYGQVSRWSFLTSRPINMDGFVHTAEGYAKTCASSGTCSGNFTDTTGVRSMGYYDQGFLNYYYYMASQFAVSDRWFSPVSSKSIDNRIATFTGGTTQGLVFDPGNDDHLGQLNIDSIFEQLDKNNITWKIYYTVTQGECLNDDDCSNGSSAVYPATDFTYLTYSHQYLYENPTGAACVAPTVASGAVGDSTNSFCIDTSHIAPLSQYYTDLSKGTLPHFSFIEAGYGNNDEHPGSGQSILSGQAEVANIVNALMSSTSWKSSIFFLSYDEGGGPYDHVPPVRGSSNKNTDASLGPIPDISEMAVNADSYKPCVPSGGAPTLHCDLAPADPGAHSGDAPAVMGFSAQLGFRVPNIIISPFTKAHYVSHTPMDHTAVIRFVEDHWLGPNVHLTARDQAQTNLLEFFDFSSPPWETPPSPPAPVTATSLGYNPCTPTNMGNN